MSMEKVTEILSRKQHHFHKVSPGCSVSEALCRMSSQNTDYLIVLDDNENFLGLLTEHDIARRTIFGNKSFTTMEVSEIMNTRFPVADADDTVEQCMRAMKRYNVRYLPVFDNHSFLGIISTDDIVREAVSVRGNIFDEEGHDRPVTITV